MGNLTRHIWTRSLRTWRSSGIPGESVSGGGGGGGASAEFGPQIRHCRRRRENGPPRVRVRRYGLGVVVRSDTCGR